MSNSMIKTNVSFTGERMEEKEVDEIMAACCDPEDEDGMIPYKRT